MNCSGCGVELEPTQDQVNQTVEAVLESSVRDARARGGVCPLCGHSKAVPISHRKSVLFALLCICMVGIAVIGLFFMRFRETERQQVATEALSRMNASPLLVSLIGEHVAVKGVISGEVHHDETGWSEAKLTFSVQGAKGQGIVRLIGGKSSGPWTFSNFEVVVAPLHKKIDLISGRVVEIDPDAYVDVHTESAKVPEYQNLSIPPARRDGKFPCVFATLGDHVSVPQLGKCDMPLLHSAPVDRVEADLRYGRFVLRETDLYLDDVFKVPLTRTYNSSEWIAGNHVHAFGKNTNHPYDIAPLGSRNPYTYQVIVLEDGDFIYFDRISKGTSYADAVYIHSETSTNFYKATQRWASDGWITRLSDGTEIHFPESYNATNLAQGAATEIVDPQGNRLELRRDARRNLLQIVTPHKHWMKFEHDDQARIVKATTDRGEWASYRYNTDGMLASVELSSGKNRYFSYDGELMTEVRDGKKILVRNEYADDRLVSQNFGSKNPVLYGYRYDWTRYNVQTATVTLSNRSQHTVSPLDSIPAFAKRNNQ